MTTPSTMSKLSPFPAELLSTPPHQYSSTVNSYRYPEQDQYYCPEERNSGRSLEYGAIGRGRPLRNSSRWNGASYPKTLPKLLIGSRIGGPRRTLENAFPSPPPRTPLPEQTETVAFQFGDVENLVGGEKYSRKVFIGGLPPDIDEAEICETFSRFGQVGVDWPHKQQTRSYFPPKGYAFLIFAEELSVHSLMAHCYEDKGKSFINVSSPSVRCKPVQIRPWCLGDSDFFTDAQMKLDARKTVFVGGVPRPLKASELASIVDRFFGGVCYAGVDTDADLKYPKGAGRVTFTNSYSYMAAIASRFLHLQTDDVDKKVEMKPYVFDDQMCDECCGTRCLGQVAPFFCANIACLKYYCQACWAFTHRVGGMRECHKPLIKDSNDRSTKGVMGRWNAS